MALNMRHRFAHGAGPLGDGILARPARGAFDALGVHPHREQERTHFVVQFARQIGPFFFLDCQQLAAHAARLAPSIFRRAARPCG